MIALITKRISNELLQFIQSHGWSYEIIETLKITPIEVKEIPVKAEAWIVSSRNSSEAVKKFIPQAPENIYCVGDWMKNEIEKLGKKVSVKSFSNMKSLVTDLSKLNFERVLYFCGEEHRHELEEGLKNSRTRISKVFTHQSEMTFPKLKKNYDSVFIFSPRSAESFLKNNSFSASTVFACIGDTTADYLKSRGVENIFISSYPDSKILIEEFYNKLKILN